MMLASELRSWVCPIETGGLPGSEVLWRDMRNEELLEPFFQQSVARIRRAHPEVIEEKASYDSLSGFEPHDLGIPPSGFIFHVSRCGSTLVANALRATGRFRVIAEAQPINALLHGTFIRRHKDAASLLRSVVMLLGNRISSNRKPYLVKFSSWNLLQISHVLSIWPQVPWVLVYRGPGEIAASILERSVGWMKGYDSEERRRDFGIDISSSAALTREEYIAKVLGLLYREAQAAIASAAAVVPYERITVDVFSAISGLFGEPLSLGELRNVEATLGLDSKDRYQRRRFERSAREQSAALMTAIDQWARSDFESLNRSKIAKTTLPW
jgi:hypothetical protein